MLVIAVPPYFVLSFLLLSYPRTLMSVSFASSVSFPFYISGYIKGSVIDLAGDGFEKDVAW